MAQVGFIERCTMVADCDQGRSVHSSQAWWMREGQPFSLSLMTALLPQRCLHTMHCPSQQPNSRLASMHGHTTCPDSEQPTVIQEQIAELEKSISHTHDTITRAHKQKQLLEGQNFHLSQRARTSVSAIEAILSVSSLLSDTPPTPDPPHQGTPCLE